AKIDLLLVGDVTVQYLSDIVQKLFSNIAKVTITISDVRKAAALLNECTFNMVFLKMTLPTAKELEAIKLIRFCRKKNIRLLFVLIIPENFKGCLSGYGADITLIEPLTMEKLSIVVKYWKTYFSNTGQSSSTSENAIGDVYKTQVPSTALFLNSFHAVNYYSTVIPSYDAVAVTNQNISVHFPSAVPKVSKFLLQQCNSVLGQTCTTHPNCLVSLLGSLIRLDSVIPASKGLDLQSAVNTLVRNHLGLGPGVVNPALDPCATGLLSTYPDR
ncbi:Spermatogenesis- and oogenesis-specific basic helix-loop-helix-containing protein 2, partial [Myotis brandtii]